MCVRFAQAGIVRYYGCWPAAIHCSSSPRSSISCRLAQTTGHWCDARWAYSIPVFLGDRGGEGRQNTIIRTRRRRFWPRVARIETCLYCPWRRVADGGAAFSRWGHPAVASVVLGAETPQEVERKRGRIVLCGAGGAFGAILKAERLLDPDAPGTGGGWLMRIDAHHHLWSLARGDYGWLTSELAPILSRFRAVGPGAASHRSRDRGNDPGAGRHLPRRRRCNLLDIAETR